MKPIMGGKKRFMYPAEGRGGSAASQSYRGLTAAVIVGVDVVGNEAGFEIALTAHGARRAAGDVQILRHNKFDAFDQHIPAIRIVVCGKCNGFHTPRIFDAVGVHFGR